MCIFKKRPIFPHLYLIKSLLYFLKIMCKLDRKYNRKMCVFDIRLPLYTFSLLYPLRACYIFKNYSLRYVCFYDD